VIFVVKIRDRRYWLRENREMTGRTVFTVLALIVALTWVTPAQQAAQGQLRSPDVIFVPTPQEVVDVMLKLAKVTKDDVVYDLGSGDGRIPITAAKVYGAKAVGIDIDPERIRDANENLKMAAASDRTILSRAKFLNQDLFTTDISEATVVTLYLLPSLNLKLLPKLNKELKPGTRVVSHAFDMGPDIKPKMDPVNVNGRTVYYYTVPIQ
jgi:predicted RNA methylase